MTRSATCAECGGPFLVDTAQGRLPSACGMCDPRAADHRDRQRRAHARCRELTPASSPILGTPAPGADRQMLAAAVRSVAEATGRDATRDALHHVRDVAQSWADALAVNVEPDPEGDARFRRRAA